MHLDSVSVWFWHRQAGVRLPVLEEVSWVIRPGERWALLGPNGAGKTTLLGVAGAVAFPSSGRVEILGRVLGRADAASIRAGLGQVDIRDAARFAPRLTVEDVIRTGATRTIGLFPDRLTQGDLEHASELLALFGLGRLGGRPLRDCSQGERARALVARALMGRPRLLLLDEPSAGVDLPGRETLLGAVDRLVADRPELALVLTTHHLEELPGSTTHAHLLAGGRTIASGPVTAALTDRNLSRCFGLPLHVERVGTRWSATARG